MFPLGPIKAISGPTPASEQLAARVELQDRRCGVGALLGRNRPRPVQNPDVISRVGGNRRDLSEHPVVRNGRPLRIELKCRRSQLARLWGLSADRGHGNEPPEKRDGHHDCCEGREYSSTIRGHVCRAPQLTLSRPSVSSMYVPQGSVMNAMERPSAGTCRYGEASLIPCDSSFFVNASRFFTSKPM